MTTNNKHDLPCPNCGSRRDICDCTKRESVWQAAATAIAAFAFIALVAIGGLFLL